MLGPEVVARLSYVFFQFADDESVFVVLLPTVVDNTPFSRLIGFAELDSDGDEVGFGDTNQMVRDPMI